MPRRTPPTHPQARRQLEALGGRLRAARLRRKMSQPMLAERVGVSTPTIAKLEDGNPSTSLATMLRVLSVLGMGADIDRLASDDVLGRSLQDSELTRAPPRRAASSRRAEAEASQPARARNPPDTGSRPRKP
jgi:transcriptional regulator with XRE-family HTH domain